MSTAIDITNNLFEFLESKLNELFAEQALEKEILWHSNVLPENNSSTCRVYINRQIISEEQDTLCVNVTDPGKVRYNTVGACAVSFFIPRSINGGYAKVERIAQGLKNALRKAQLDCLWVRNPKATPYSMEQNSYRYEVTFNYEFDEIV